MEAKAHKLKVRLLVSLSPMFLDRERLREKRLCEAGGKKF